MSKFALIDIEQVKGIIPFKKLVINGQCQFDDFCNQIEANGNLRKQLIGLVSSMNEVANLKRLPKEKFRDVTPKGEAIKEFEIKKGDLRIYLIKEDGHIVVMGGKKNTQTDDIRQFRSVKKQYLESKKTK